MREVSTMAEYTKLHRITATEAAEMLGMSKWTVYRMVRAGSLPIARVIHVNRNDTFLIYREWVEEFLRGER